MVMEGVTKHEEKNKKNSELPEKNSLFAKYDEGNSYDCFVIFSKYLL
jgi:hypothetical protein